MKHILILASAFLLILTSCEQSPNETAEQEQAHTEKNQARLLAVQPPPDITWSLERDNLSKRFKLQNDRSVMFYMYVFIEGISDPIGYYQVNKVSSVNSQLTNPDQMVNDPHGSTGVGSCVLSSPAEDGSYGTNGDAVFGFTPESVYIEHNMRYIVSSIPLTFTNPVNRLTVINVKTQKELDKLMKKLK